MQSLDRFREAFGALQHFIERLLQHLCVEQLLAVFPFVQRLRLVEALVTLQANQGQIEHLRRRLREFRLADAWRPFDQNGFAQVIREIDRCRNLLGTDIAMRFEMLLE